MIYILILALVQGLTEFLPVSSSGHLEIFKHIPWLAEAGAGLRGQISENMFNLVLHFGTLLAVLLYFYRDLLAILTGGWQFLRLSGAEKKQWWAWWRGRSEKPESFVQTEAAISPESEAAAEIESSPDAVRELFYLFVACLPLLVVPIFKDQLDGLLRGGSQGAVSLNTLAIIYAFNSLILLSTYALRGNGRSLRMIGLTSAVIIGFSQVIAILPGISRSGITITTALWLGIHQVKAARFSLLLSIPTILAGILLEGKDMLESATPGAAGPAWGPLLAGVLVAFLVGWASIRFLIALVRDMRFHHFGVYTLLLALFLVFWSLIA